jgi:hypothetical protein
MNSNRAVREGRLLQKRIANMVSNLPIRHRSAGRDLKPIYDPGHSRDIDRQFQRQFFGRQTPG